MEKKYTKQNHHPLAIQAKDLAKLLGVSVRQVWRLNSMGKLPKPIRIGGSVRWLRSQIISWLELDCPDRQAFETLKKSECKCNG